MMQQGLGALVPQQPAGQAPENPVRMAAAMDVVTSDAEENILDPRTLALLKYKDAVRAMQAADQMMAAAQPQPMPPTVAERTRLAAEQGIAGLAQRLAPGVQQRGAQIAAQQGAGGLPQLAAPNMARMAGGGIVAFQKGGGPLPTAGGREEDYVVTTDELGNPIYASDIARALAAGAMDTSEEGAARRAAYAALQTDRPNLREIARTPEGSVSSAERVPTAGYGMGDRTGQGEVLTGMASGVADSVRRGLGSLVPAGGSDEGGSMTRRGLRTPVEGDADSGRSSSGRIGRAAVAASAAAPAEDASDEPSALGEFSREALDWVKENPEDAISLGLTFVPGLGLLGAGVRGLGALLKSRRAAGLLSKLVTKPNPAFASVGPNLPGTAARVFSPMRTLNVASGLGIAGLQTSKALSGGDEEVPADTPTAATEMVAPDAVEALVGQQSPSEPAARRPVERISEEEALAAISPSGPKDAFEYLMAYGQAPEREQQTAAATPQSRDDRMRRIIAGLRGLGSQGVGGFAAGVSDEALRMEQELTAEEERKRRAKMEERGFDLEERNIELQSEQARVNAENNRYTQVMNLVQNYQGMSEAQQQKLGSQVLAATKGLSDQLQNVNTALALGDLSSDEQERYEVLKNNLEQQIASTVETVTVQYGAGTDYTPIVEALLQSVMPTGMGAGASRAGSFNANDFTMTQLPAQ